MYTHQLVSSHLLIHSKWVLLLSSVNPESGILVAFWTNEHNSKKTKCTPETTPQTPAARSQYQQHVRHQTRSRTPGESGQEDHKDAGGRHMLRVWLPGKIVEFLAGFEEGDEVALVLDMRH